MEFPSLYKEDTIQIAAVNKTLCLQAPETLLFGAVGRYQCAWVCTSQSG